MTKQQLDDETTQNISILPSSSKSNKLKSSKMSRKSSRLSHLLSKISRKDKKTSNNYYIPAEPPFTSTPDMSEEEDAAVEVSYVETESENNGDSENTIPITDSTNAKATPSRMIYVDSAILDDSTTTTTTTTATTASADYSSSLTSRNMNTEEQMIRTDIITCISSDQQVVQPITEIITANDARANSESYLRKIWYVL
uniref:Uncharacterized protein n=1 Tax=Loa loa TaxID=7209 RepID=A0A1I7VCF2_LOALO